MTTGNRAARPPAPDSRTKLRFVDTMLELIAEQGGSLGVNLRQVSRRVGCAHTNVYNYYDSYGDLRWAAFRQALRVYGEHLVRDLDVDLEPTEYLRHTVTNLATFPQQEPGIYRFVGSDPLDLGTVPPDIMETVTAMKHWFATVVQAAAGPAVAPPEARAVADILLAYIDGETLNLINGRAVPDEDLAGRIVANALRLFGLLTADATDEPHKGHRAATSPPEPASIFGT